MNQRNNKRKAVFGKPASYYENRRMIARSQKFRKGSFVRIKFSAPRLDWVDEQVQGKVGVVIDAHPYGWDAAVQFSNTQRQGGVFCFWTHDLEVVNKRQYKKELREKRNEFWRELYLRIIAECFDVKPMSDEEWELHMAGWEDYLWEDLQASQDLLEDVTHAYFGDPDKKSNDHHVQDLYSGKN